MFGTPAHTCFLSQVSVQQYHQIADDVMDRLVEQLEQMIEDSGVPEYEVDYSVCPIATPRFPHSPLARLGY